MKYVAAFIAAGTLALTLTASAQAVEADLFEADALRATQGAPLLVRPGEYPHHPCQGLASGTAHRSCGSLTGGPSGGLF